MNNIFGVGINIDWNSLINKWVIIFSKIFPFLTVSNLWWILGSHSAQDLKLVQLLFSSHIRNAQHFSDNRGRIVRCGLLSCDYSSAARTSSLADYSYFMPRFKFKVKLILFCHFQHSLFYLFFIFRWFGEIPKKLGQRGPFAKTRDLLFLSNTTPEATMAVTSIKTFSHPLLVL